ncbi:RNA methyltransferase, TrmH family [Teladorsagia circumcincta]|uniref:RNA methyltransferase, TrmH family n=1 Tax=Teladorsagia circumcincta TaxID=45464 RepID=A0A2G9UUP5_TELCI|nr:RNA methyltransferase, TrmH family [Teladorsagia circumcincta]
MPPPSICNGATVSCPQTLLTMLEAAFSIMNEERKSQHFLPALRRTLSLSLKKSVVALPNITQFVLVRLLYCYVFALAVFGPIPKKEQRVLNAAYEMIYENRINEFDDVHNSFGLSLAHRQNTRAAALLLFVADYVHDEDVIDKVFSNCVGWIEDPCQQFSIKLLLEWLLVRLASRSVQMKQRVIDLETSFATKRIGSVSSWINMMVLMSRTEASETSLAPYVELILPWTTAQNFAVRCTAIAALRLLYNALPTEQKVRWNLLRKVVEFDGEPAGNSKRIIENLSADFYFAHLHPIKHFDMQTVLLEIPAKTGMPSEETIGVDILKVCFAEVGYVILAHRNCVFIALSKSNRCAPDINEGEMDAEMLEHEGSSLVQRKLITKERSKREDCSIVVVASLVDKPNNLGGLCRTCEIFGVDELIIADPIFLADAGFKALSMSSERKQKMEFVNTDRLPHYLEEMRRKGYTVIAAEQTTDSVFLHKFAFPRKTVLLLGDEKEGVPTNLLRCVDQTVEIQQLGQTRSLNVHVSAALFIAKYAEQVLLS